MGHHPRAPLYGVLSLLSVLGGCGDDTPPGAPDDAGDPVADAGTPGADAGPRADAGPPADDAGRRDAGRPTMGRDAGRPAVDAGRPDAGAGGDDAGPLTVTACYDGVFEGPVTSIEGPDYDPFMPTVGSHCLGTNHQDIADVERVVFLGDSVTVGTPPTLAADFYRARLADALADRFGLEAPSPLWREANPLDGRALLRESGDFASCAKWGARTDDLLRDSTQIEDCFPVAERDKTTLVIMTIGGNDVAAITKAGAGADARPIEEVWDMTREFVGLFRDAVGWFTEERFPNGVFVVFSNMHEFTDGTGDISSCETSALAGFDEWEDPSDLADMVVWANEQFLDVAVETGTDMLFMLEHFCGHGHHADNPDAPCYRGPGTEVWLDFTCTHPNPRGHRELADMFLAVVSE